MKAGNRPFYVGHILLNKIPSFLFFITREDSNSCTHAYYTVSNHLSNSQGQNSIPLALYFCEVLEYLSSPQLYTGLWDCFHVSFLILGVNSWRSKGLHSTLNHIGPLCLELQPFLHQLLSFFPFPLEGHICYSLF